MESLIDETRLLFHRMKLAAEQLHDAEEITAGMRGVLFSLDRSCPQTVPGAALATRDPGRRRVAALDRQGTLTRQGETARGATRTLRSMRQSLGRSK